MPRDVNSLTREACMHAYYCISLRGEMAYEVAKTLDVGVPAARQAIERGRKMIERTQ